MKKLKEEELIKINTLQKQESKIMKSIRFLLESEPELTLEALIGLGKLAECTLLRKGKVR
jgi:hypothetical protein